MKPRSLGIPLLFTLALTGCGSGEVGPPASSADTSAATSSTTCPPADGSAERKTTFDGPPPMCIDAAKTYSAKVVTDAGDVTIALDAKKAPITVNNFVVLSRYHFYDGIVFHRVIQGFMAQGGDPEGTGRGGPGYKFADELPKTGEYQIGSVAMANAGANTNGSQFFIVTGDQGVRLQPDYSLFGSVTEGMETVKAIEADGSAGGGPPAKVHIITSVSITET